MRRTLVFCLGALCWLASPSSFAAAPMLVQMHGRLLDANDTPVEGVVSLTVSLYDVEENPADAPAVPALWSATYDTTVSQGAFAIMLGSTPAGQPVLDGVLFEGSGPLWVGIAVAGGSELRPRLRLGSTPYALVANRAARADSAALADSAVRADSAALADDASRLGDLEPAYYLAAENLTGTVPAWALPLATAEQPGAMTPEEKAKLAGLGEGAALRSLSATAPLSATGGAQPELSLPRASAQQDGYLAKEDFAKFDSALSSVKGTPPIAVDEGTISILPASPTQAGSMSATDKAKLDRLLAITAERPAGAEQGTLIFNTTTQALELYTGTGWITFAKTLPQSCRELRDSGAGTTSGAYAIEPSPGRVMQVYCNQETDEGGWTLVARVRGGGREFAPYSSHWSSASTIYPESQGSIEDMGTMKSGAWATVPGNVLRVCYRGPDAGCATFTHNMGVPLSKVFASTSPVDVTENWTWAGLSTAFGVANTGTPGAYYCGLNLAFSPAASCTVVSADSRTDGSDGAALRVGCIGDANTAGLAGCTGGPDDYALGIGVTSCADGGGCGRVGSGGNITPSHHIRGGDFQADRGYVDSTSYLYVR